MATIYFTNNSDSGEGSLREAISNASSGDTISPDPDVFAVGSTISINLLSAITISKNIDVRGAGRKISVTAVHEPGETHQCLRFSSSNYGLFEDINFFKAAGTTYLFAAYRATSSDKLVTFNRCFIADCTVTGTQLVAGYVSINNSVITNCIGTIGSGDTLAENSTMAFNSGGIASGFVSSKRKNCITSINEDYVSAPSSNITSDTFVEEAWKSWNLHLATTSEKTTGNTTEELTYDIEGNMRIAGGALGAYESFDVPETGKVKAFFDNGVWKDKRYNGETLSSSTADVYYILSKDTWNTQLPNMVDNASIVVGGFQKVSINGTIGEAVYGLGANVYFTSGSVTYTGNPTYPIQLISSGAALTVKNAVEPILFASLTTSGRIVLENCQTTRRTLIIPSDASSNITISGGSFTIETLTLSGGTFTIKDATFEAGNIDFSGGTLSTDSTTGVTVVENITLSGTPSFLAPVGQVMVVKNVTLGNIRNMYAISGYITVESQAIADAFTYVAGGSVVTVKTTTASSAVVQLDGDDILVTVTKSQASEDGSVVLEVYDGSNWNIIDNETPTSVEMFYEGLITTSETVFPVRVFDGENFVTAETGRTYYYVGDPELGSFTDPTDWAYTKDKSNICTVAPQIQYGIFDARTQTDE